MKSENTVTQNAGNSLNSFVTQVPQHKELHAFKFDPYSPKHNLYYVSEITRAFR